MNRQIIFRMAVPLLMFITFSVSFIMAQDENPELFIHEAFRAQTTPKIDGRLDDACWQKVQKWNGFTASANKKAEVQTSFTALYDDQYFYLGITCNEPKISGLIANKLKNDSPVWDDDSVEFFVDLLLETGNYYQFIVNSKGTKYDGCKKTGKDWNPAWDVKTNVSENAWTIEIRIPFSIFDQDMKNQKTSEIGVWGFAVCRSRYAAGNICERSYFGAIYQNHHQPKLFGRLISKEFILKECLKEKDKTSSLIKKNPHLFQQLEQAFNENGKRLHALASVIQNANLNNCAMEHNAIITQYKSIAKQYQDLEWDAKFEELFKK